jgi:hypothetical protein
MDKKSKQRRQKSATQEELTDITSDITPRGASFDTEEGRAAQGMRPDIGAGGGDTVEMEGAVGASDGNSGAGKGAGIPDGETGMTPPGEPATRGDEQEDREKLFPEAKSRGKKPEA